jgi:hypothetical protein
VLNPGWMPRAKITRLLFEATPTGDALPIPGVIPIGEARLCLDCEVICASTRCPQCAGRSLHPISSWLKSMPQPVLRLERRRPGTDRRRGPSASYKGPERRKADRRRTPR